MNGELFPIGRHDVLAELRRELVMRDQVYPAIIATGRLTPEMAERRKELVREAIRLLSADPQ